MLGYAWIDNYANINGISRLDASLPLMFWLFGGIVALVTEYKYVLAQKGDNSKENKGYKDE